MDSEGGQTASERMSLLPAGTVTFVFTDVEGSTRMLRRLGDVYADVLARHRRIIETSFEGGEVFGTEGDAVFAAFASAEDAVRGTLRAQSALMAEDWPNEETLAVRMGVHTGSVDLVGSNYVGLEVHRAARISAAAHGGQVLVSNATRALFTPDGDVQFEELGRFQLKDFDEPQTLYQVCTQGARLQFPPPRTATARVVSLPREATALLGRVGESERLLRLLQDGRVITITGTGGSGKSALAIHVAWVAAPRFKDTVAFVPLAPLTSIHQVPAAVARAIRQEGAFERWEDFAEALRPQHCLLVFDNAEHLRDIGQSIDGLLDRCDRLHLIITSRMPVKVAGERTYVLDPLEADDARALLIERVREHQPAYRVPDDQEAVIGQITERLGCLPLAIELAAARLRLLSPIALLERLDRQLDLLKSGRADLADRQRTLRGAIEWSYQLLDPHDAEVFCALTTFAGPAQLAALAAVARLDEFETLDALQHLLEANFVRLAESGDEPRYWMLEPIRQYGAAQLEESGADHTARNRLIDWLVDASSMLTDPSVDPLRAFRSDMDTLLRALEYCEQERRWDAGITLAFRFRTLLYVVGGTSYVHRWLDRVPENEDLGESARIKLDLFRAVWRGLNAEALEEALRAAKVCGDKEVLMGAYEAALQSYWVRGMLDEADETIVAMESLVGSNAYQLLSVARTSLGTSALRDGWRRTEAERLLAQLERAGNELKLVTMLNEAAWLAVLGGDPVWGLERASDAVRRSMELGLVQLEEASRHTAALAAMLVGDQEAAAEHLEALLPMAELLDPNGEEDVQWAVLTVAAFVAPDQPDRAARLAGFVRHEELVDKPVESGPHLYQPYLRLAEDALGDERWDELRQEGQRMTVREAVEDAAEALHAVKTTRRP